MCLVWRVLSYISGGSHAENEGKKQKGFVDSYWWAPSCDDIGMISAVETHSRGRINGRGSVKDFVLRSKAWRCGA